MRWKVGTGKSVGACRVCPEMVSPHPGDHDPTAVDWLRQALGMSSVVPHALPMNPLQPILTHPEPFPPKKSASPPPQGRATGVTAQRARKAQNRAIPSVN